jgi:hypothetical protein
MSVQDLPVRTTYFSWLEVHAETHAITPHGIVHASRKKMFVI